MTINVIPLHEVQEKNSLSNVMDAHRSTLEGQLIIISLQHGSCCLVKGCHLPHASIVHLLGNSFSWANKFSFNENANTTNKVNITGLFSFDKAQNRKEITQTREIKLETEVDHYITALQSQLTHNVFCFFSLPIKLITDTK